MDNKFIVPPTDRAWNTKCDIHGWWVKTALAKECPWCKCDIEPQNAIK